MKPTKTEVRVDPCVSLSDQNESNHHKIKPNSLVDKTVDQKDHKQSITQKAIADNHPKKTNPALLFRAHPTLVPFPIPSVDKKNISQDGRKKFIYELDGACTHLLALDACLSDQKSTDNVKDYTLLFHILRMVVELHRYSMASDLGNEEMTYFRNLLAHFSVEAYGESIRQTARQLVEKYRGDSFGLSRISYMEDKILFLKTKKVFTDFKMSHLALYQVLSKVSDNKSNNNLPGKQLLGIIQEKFIPMIVSARDQEALMMLFTLCGEWSRHVKQFCNSEFKEFLNHCLKIRNGVSHRVTSGINEHRSEAFRLANNIYKRNSVSLLQGFFPPQRLETSSAVSDSKGPSIKPCK